jgi:alpha-galactosidase
MGKTIVLLGVGSTYFTRGIVESLIVKGGDWDVRLVDIDPQALEIATRLAQRLVAAHDAPVTVRGSLERREVLPGADAVVSTIGVGGRRAWEKDVTIFRQFDVYQSTGDTYGAGGVSRALRTIPVLVEVARDIERLCPGALLINFTNPMTVNCWAVSKTSAARIAGLCYGVTYYEHYLARFIGVPWPEVSCRAIGVNHFTWITEFRHQGRDAWPLVRAKLGEKAGTPEMERNRYTWELFRLFDAYPCVGDGHICEFVPGWQRRGAYYGRTFGVDAGHPFEEYAAGFDRVYQEMENQAYGRAPLAPIDDDRSGETFRDEDLFIDVLSAAMGEGEIMRTVNLPNVGQAANLPRGAVLEATTLISGAGFEPLCFGDLPLGITAILQRILSVQELTVQAALRADRKLALQALVAGETVRTEAEAERMLDLILETHREYLPQFHAGS